VRADEDAHPALPRVDYHVHLDNSSIEQVQTLAAERGVRFGIVEHAGTKENVYPVVLSNDAELIAYLDGLDGHDVFKGVQAEWIDWAGCFSKSALARLDYVLTDAMTFPGRDGRRVKLWEPDVADRVDMANPDRFMDRFVDWHVEILTTQPIDLLANVSWLPATLAEEYDRHWTDARIRRVVDTAVKQGIALEISASYQLPQLRFLRIAREAGARFSFGSNGRYPKMGLLDYSLEMARALSLTPADLFTPPPGGCRASREG
jgi:histidinol phosphatase-like PHP family hydrolase